MPIGLLVLTFAAFAIGTSEFIIAGILPNLAADFKVSIPTAGLLVSVYATAVAVGGPILALVTAQLPRKPLIVFLLGVFSIGQALCALAPSYSWLMAGRVFSACSHGLFFGAGSVAAIGLVTSQRRGMAMALFLGGITIANLMGVPAGTAIGNAFGWRWTFWTVAACGLVATFATAWLLPGDRGQSEQATSLKDEFRAIRHQQVYLSYLVIFLVMVGSLAFATYQVPLMIAVTGISQEHTPLYLVISGVGAIIGIYAGGRFADWKLMPSLVTVLLAAIGGGGVPADRNAPAGLDGGSHVHFQRDQLGAERAGAVAHPERRATCAASRVDLDLDRLQHRNRRRRWGWRALDRAWTRLPEPAGGRRHRQPRGRRRRRSLVEARRHWLTLTGRHNCSSRSSPSRFG